MPTLTPLRQEGVSPRFSQAAAPPVPRHGASERPPGAPGAPDRPSGIPERPPGAGDVEARVGGIARAVAQGAVEVLDGSRPAQQLSRWLDPSSYEKLQFRAGLQRTVTASTARAACPGPQPGLRACRNVAVRSARLCRVSETAYEAALVVLDRTRARAVALRVEHRRGDWKVTALEIG